MRKIIFLSVFCPPLLWAGTHVQQGDPSLSIGGISVSTVAISQLGTGSTDAETIQSSGTGAGLRVIPQGTVGGGVQQRAGAITIGDDSISRPLNALVVLVDSTTDSQVGAGLLEIWEDNPNHNDPIVWVRRNSSSSGPEFRVDGLAPNFETVDTSTANSVGRGKFEVYGQPFQSEIFQMPNSRCWDNSSFENEAYWEPLNIQSSVATPGIYLQASSNSGCDSGIVTNSNTSGVNFYTTNSHTVGITGPLSVASGSWRIRLPATIPSAGQLIVMQGADSLGDYPMSLTNTITSSISVVAATTGLYDATFSTSSAIFHVAVSTSGHFITNGGVAPTISSCGSTPNGSVVGDDNEGTITIGGTAPTACTLSFSKTWGSVPTCTITDNSTTISDDISSISATQMVLGFGVGGLAGGSVWYRCGCSGSGCL